MALALDKIWRDPGCAAFKKMGSFLLCQANVLTWVVIIIGHIESKWKNYKQTPKL